MADQPLTSTDVTTKPTSHSKRITNITEEEQSLLAQEGIVLPTDVPLTKVLEIVFIICIIILHL